MSGRNRWDGLGTALGRMIADQAKGRERQLDQAWSLFRSYAPPDTVANVDRMMALVELGFPPTATPSDDEITEAYRKIARENHPDRRPNDPEAAERMKSANAAREVLLKRG